MKINESIFEIENKKSVKYHSYPELLRSNGEVALFWPEVHEIELTCHIGEVTPMCLDLNLPVIYMKLHLYVRLSMRLNLPGI